MWCRLRRRLGLVLEALQLARVQRRRERQHLQRHPPAQRDLLGLVDDAHAAAAHLAEDPEVAQRSQVGAASNPILSWLGLRAHRPYGGSTDELRLARQASRSSARSGCSARRADLSAPRPRSRRPGNDRGFEPGGPRSPKRRSSSAHNRASIKGRSFFERSGPEQAHGAYGAAHRAATSSQSRSSSVRSTITSR